MFASLAELLNLSGVVSTSEPFALSKARLRKGCSGVVDLTRFSTMELASQNKVPWSLTFGLLSAAMTL